MPSLDSAIAVLGAFRPLPPPPPDRRLFGLELGGGAPSSVQNFRMETQEQTNWCWAATAVSVARKYAAAAQWSQCSLATALYAAQGRALICCGDDRSACNLPQKLSEVFGVAGHLAEALDDAIGFDDLKAEIARDRPVCVRIGWKADPNDGHFIAVTGCRVSSDGEQYVHVQDPSAQDDAADNQKDMTFDELVDGYDHGAGEWTWTYRTRP
jgi:hypothetical protein